MFLEVLFDPFVIFSLSCIAAPMSPALDPNIGKDDVIAYFTNPYMLAALALFFTAVIVTKSGKCVKLSYSDRMLARWYLLNGVLIHMLMDGAVGVFKVEPYFAKHYKALDVRYGDAFGTFNGSAVHIVSLMELFVKGPICVALYYCIHRGSKHRDALEFFTCVTQVYGTIVYLGQELVSGGKNFDVDWNFEFSLHYLFYFWFAVIFGCVLYLIVPTIVGFRVYTRLVASSPPGGLTAAPAKLKK